MGFSSKGLPARDAKGEDPVGGAKGLEGVASGRRKRSRGQHVERELGETSEIEDGEETNLEVRVGSLERSLLQT